MRLHTRIRKVVLQLAVLTVGLATPAASGPDFEATSPDILGTVLGAPAIRVQPDWMMATLCLNELALADRGERAEAVQSDVTSARRTRPTAPRLEGDHPVGRIIEVGGRSDLGYEYYERFNGPNSLDDPAVEGGLSLSLDPTAQALVIQGPESGRQRVTLSYHFTSPFPMKELVSELEGEIQGSQADAVQLMLSPNGREYGFAPHAYGRAKGNVFRLTTVGSDRFENSTGFWVRIAAELGPKSSVAIRGFRAACRVKPPAIPQIALQPRGDGLATYRETFQSSRLLHLAEIENGRALEWAAGRMFIRGQASDPVRVVVRQRFITSVPLRAVVVRVRNAANGSEGGAANLVGLSLDGQNLVAREATPASAGVFEGETEVRLDDPARLAEARQFFLHIELSNRAGVPAAPSNWVSSIEVQARTAGQAPIARLSAVPAGPDRP